MKRGFATIFAAVMIAACGVADAAAVRGSVHFDGTVPKPTVIPGAKCHVNAADILSEAMVVSKDGGLQNAIIYVEGASASASATNPVILDQKNCRYVPHVLAIQINQPLTIKTSDATLHNVHYSPEINPPANFAVLEPGQERTVSFKQPEIFKINCNVHTWMSAWVAVFDHPFFSVTTDAGSFEIKSVPAGSYKLICWHERFGKLEKQIDVTDKDLSADFIYKAPD
jgi:hypothetical protein